MFSVKRRNRLLLTVAVLSSPFGGAVGSAQEVDSGRQQVDGQQSTGAPIPDDTAPRDGEIIVTAQKRAGNIQDVPVSVAAIGGLTLENKGIDSVLDIAQMTPGVAVSTNGPGLSQVIIRGISSSSGSQATTGLYIDEVPVSVLSQNIEASSFDLDRVEVLRGPQGTLYGSASMGGAIKYISNQPNAHEFLARGNASLSRTQGGGTNGSLNAVVNLPLIENRAAIRIVGFYKSEDGYIDRYQIDPNNYLAADLTVSPEKNVNSYKIWGGRVSVRVEPTSNLVITPSVYYQKLNSKGLFSFDDPPGSYSNLVQTRGTAEPSRDEVTIYNLTAVQKISSDIDLTSSSSYFVRNRWSSEDQSKFQYILMGLFAPGVQTTVYPQYQTSADRTKVFTQEVRLSGEIGPVEFVVGGYYQHSTVNWNQDWPFMPGWREAFGDPFPGAETLYTLDEVTRSSELAAFGQATWHVTDRLRATAGLRGFKFRQNLISINDGVYNGGRTEDKVSASSSGLTPKISIDYDVTPDVLLYATAAKGFRAGGAQPPVPVTVCGTYLAELGYSSSPTQYKPDSLWSYELGVKSQLADRRITVNAAAYHIDWSGIQQRVELLCGFPFTANFGKAVSQGVELETTWRVSDNLTLGLNGGYNDAHLTNAAPGTISQKGDRLLNVPKYTVSASLDYHRQISDDVEVFVSGSFSYVSDVLAEYDRTSRWQKRPAYELVDAQIGLGEVDGRWRAALFADNLFNKHATPGTQFAATGLIDPTFRSITVNKPRTIGLNLSGRF